MRFLDRFSGESLCAASAAVVFEGIVQNTNVITHLPGPNGLPGGYPVRVYERGVELVLPAYLPLSEAIEVNTAGLHYDGIEKIDDDGTVYFTKENMSIFNGKLLWHAQRRVCGEHHLSVPREAKQALFTYLEIFYNRIRRHSTLGYVSPLIYEQRRRQDIQGNV